MFELLLAMMEMSAIRHILIKFQDAQSLYDFWLALKGMSEDELWGVAVQLLVGLGGLFSVIGWIFRKIVNGLGLDKHHGDDGNGK